MDFLNFIKPGNTIQPGAGKLLIAEPFLQDNNFSRSVVLLCEHGEEGTVGFILNHLTELTLGELLPDLSFIKADIYEGGPVQTDTLHILHRIPDVLGGKEICQGIYWGGSYDILQEILHDNTYKPENIRLFVGYTGWSPGQLDKELEEGSWFVTEMPSASLLQAEPANVWKEAISFLGKEYQYLANMPINPQLN